MGILSVVGTPIGNLGDMTYRAVETLEKADFICAEDTRVTAKLLNYFDLKTATCELSRTQCEAGGREPY